MVRNGMVSKLRIPTIYSSKQVLSTAQSINFSPVVSQQCNAMENREDSVYRQCWLIGLGILNRIQRPKEITEKQQQTELQSLLHGNEQSEIKSNPVVINMPKKQSNPIQQKKALANMALEICLSDETVMKKLGNLTQAKESSIEDVHYLDNEGNRKIWITFDIEGTDNRGTVHYVAIQESSGQMKTQFVKVEMEKGWKRKVVVEDNRTLFQALREYVWTVNWCSDHGLIKGKFS